MAVSFNPYLDFLGLTLIAILVLLSMYGVVKSRVRYYRVGMFFMLLGFIFSLGDGLTRVFGFDVQYLAPGVWIGGNFLLIIGIFVLTVYRGRLGL